MRPTSACLLRTAWICLSLTAASAPVCVSGALRIRGEVETSANGTKQTLPFDIKLGSSYQITTAPKLQNPVEFVTGFADGDSYHLKRIRGEDSLKEAGWVDQGGFPSQHYGSGQFLWLALCSGKFLDQLPKAGTLTTNQFPLFDCFRKNPAFYHDDLEVRIVRGEGPEALPKEVEFTGPPYVVDGTGDRTDLKAGRFVAAKFTVTRMTNCAAFSLPLEFQLVRYLPPGFKMTDTGSSVAEEFWGRVQSIETIAEPASYLPEIQTLSVLVCDSRFSAATGQPELGYIVGKKQWWPRTDPALQEVVKRQKERPQPLGPSRFTKRIVWGWMIATCIVIAVLIHRTWRRKEA